MKQTTPNLCQNGPGLYGPGENAAKQDELWTRLAQLEKQVRSLQRRVRKFEQEKVIGKK